MKWKSEKEIGRRRRRKFAWLPVTKTNKDTVWLEHFLVLEEWIQFPLSQGFWATSRVWQEGDIDPR